MCIRDRAGTLSGQPEAQSHHQQVDGEVHPHGLTAQDNVVQVAQQQHQKAHQRQGQQPGPDSSGPSPVEPHRGQQIGPEDNLYVLPQALVHRGKQGRNGPRRIGIEKMQRPAQNYGDQTGPQQRFLSIIHPNHLSSNVCRSPPLHSKHSINFLDCGRLQGIYSTV